MKLIDQLFLLPPPPVASESETVFRTAGAHMWLKLLKTILFLLVVPLSSPAFFDGFGDPVAHEDARSDFGMAYIEFLYLVSAVGAFVIAIAVALADRYYRWYVLSDRSLTVRQGVVNLRRQTLSFANIQNVEVSQGPLQGLFGISTVSVSVAGGGSAKGSNTHGANFVGVKEAEVIKKAIVDRQRRLLDAEAQSLDPEIQSDAERLRAAISRLETAV